MNSIIIIFMEKDSTPGLTVENTKVNGKQIKCTEKELSHGQMVENISVNMLKTKRKATENSSGLIEDAIEGNG